MHLAGGDENDGEVVSFLRDVCARALLLLCSGKGVWSVCRNGSPVLYRGENFRVLCAVGDISRQSSKDVRIFNRCLTLLYMRRGQVCRHNLLYCH